MPKTPFKTHWNDLSGIQQADVLAFDQIRQHDDQEWDAKLVGAGMPAPKPAKRSRKR